LVVWERSFSGGFGVIDTMAFFIPISLEDFKYLTNKTMRTIKIDQKVKEEGNDVGSLIFDFHNFNINLPESWQYGISGRISRDIWEYDEKSRTTWLNKSGWPYVRLEFSIPKVLHGHNLYSCDFDSVVDACFMVRQAFKDEYELELPDLTSWYPCRIDTCANYVLNSLDEVLAWLRYCSKFEYPRKPRFYQDSTLYWATRYSTFKCYAKGPEFKVHDAARIRNDIEGRRLQNFANQILRIEVEHRGKLKNLAQEAGIVNLSSYEMQLGHCEVFRKLLLDELALPGTSDDRKKEINMRLTGLFFEIRELEEKMLSEKLPSFHGFLNLYDLMRYFDPLAEMEKAMDKFTMKQETKVMRSADVFELLQTRMSSRSANFYYGMFVNLVTHGVKFCREHYKDSSFRKGKKVFRELGISLFCTDLEKVDLPTDFDLEAAFLDRGFPRDFSTEMSADNHYYQLPLRKVAL
jgi:hypothetical protein